MAFWPVILQKFAIREPLGRVCDDGKSHRCVQIQVERAESESVSQISLHVPTQELTEGEGEGCALMGEGQPAEAQPGDADPLAAWFSRHWEQLGNAGVVLHTCPSFCSACLNALF